jgi:hypothetical protein
MWMAFISIILLALAGSFNQAAAQSPATHVPIIPGLPVLISGITQLPPTQITGIHVGPITDSFAIATVAPIANPAGCREPDRYMTDSTQPDYHTLYAAALLAFAEHETVSVLTSAIANDCIAEHPKLSGLIVVR